jgi:thiol-disulfide isomerase/thioredoxin
LAVLAETAERLGASYDEDAVSQSSVGLSPVLSVPVEGVFGGSNRGILTLIDANYKFYSIVVAGPEDTWDSDYAVFAGDMMTALSVNPALPTLTDGPVPTGLQMGLLAPDFTVPLLDGGTVSLSDYRGRAVVLTFWATWCPPCREEMPVFAEIAAERDDVVFFAVDNRETDEVVAAFRDTFNMGFPIGMDPSGEIGDRYNVIYLPTTLVLDADGIIRYIPREVDNIQRADVMGWLAFAGVE